MGEKTKKPTFSEAVQAIVESHTRLYGLLMEALPAYRGEAELPPREKRVSRILDCETNDAHRLLENLATAAKGQNLLEGSGIEQKQLSYNFTPY